MLRSCFENLPNRFVTSASGALLASKLNNICPRRGSIAGLYPGGGMR
jgi:hypothetical protein